MLFRSGQPIGRIDPFGVFFIPDPGLVVVALDPARAADRGLWPDAPHPLHERLLEVIGRLMPLELIVLPVPGRGSLVPFPRFPVPVTVLSRDLTQYTVGGLVFRDGTDLRASTGDPTLRALPGPLSSPDPQTELAPLWISDDGTGYLSPLGGFAEPFPEPFLARVRPVSEYPPARQ